MSRVITTADRASFKRCRRQWDFRGSIYPTRSDDNCPPCPFREPCRVLSAGQDAAPILRSRYRQRPPDRPEEGRPGGGAWGMGRGAAPPKFRTDHSGLPR
jgi:hypothetical protein